MNKLFPGLLLCLLCKAAVFASPVYPRPHQVVQPDGSRLTLVGHGDEFCHYITTTDGYTLVKAADGFYHYATEQDGQLTATLQRASDVEKRTAEEVSFLSEMTRCQKPEPSLAAKRLLKAQASMAHDEPSAALSDAVRTSARAASPRRGASAEVPANYRGLVILVEFTDRQFSRGTDATVAYYDMMLNKVGFTTYKDAYYGRQSYTGSLRDYFNDQSYGQFDPTFDIVGPISLPYSQYFVDGVTNVMELTEDVLARADEQVDFSQYDSNGDGDVDMIYLLYAGYASSYQGNDERLMWPHASTLIDPEGVEPDIVYDGVRMARFAASAEIFGWEEDGDLLLDGIGIVCHEFSHVLGFMDHYDVLGYQEHPNTWDVMSAGNYNGYFNRTPCAYNSYEKAVAGFLEPRDLTALDDEQVTLASIETSSDAAVIHSKQEHVHYYLDNRQPDKWDKYLVGHGMLVWRVDSVVPEYWLYNYVNVTTRACFRLVRACSTQGDILSGVEDCDYDPFPGTRDVTSLLNEPGPSNLLSYDRYPCPVELRAIAENEGLISFWVDQDELAEARPVTYDFPEHFVAQAERLVDDEWVPVSWTVSSGQETINGVDCWVLYNLLPNEIGIESDTRDYSNGVFVYYGYNADAVSGYVDSQRVGLTDDYGIWICDFTDVAQQGSGSIQFKVSRYGIPSLLNQEAEIGWCAMKRTAVVVSESKMIDRLDVYRNVTFSEEGQEPPSAIENVMPDDNVTDGVPVIMNLQGQKMDRLSAGINIVNGKKLFIKK